MSTAKPIITVKASASFTLNEDDLTGKNVGESILTPKHTVFYSDGLQFWLDYCPAGWTEAAPGFVSVYLFVSKPLKATFTFVVDGSSIKKTDTKDFSERPCNWGFSKFASHEQLRPLFHDGKLTITCNVKFEVPTLSFSNPRVFQLFEHIPTDVEFAIGAERVPAHKNFLFMISPVLQAMFTHDTVESKTGIIDITEFDFDIVKTAIDICYGREFEELLVDTAVGVLRFCDKYFITPVIKELENLPLLHPSVETFCAIIQYAYDCNKDSLLTICYDFFKEHQNEIKITEKFAKLPLTLVITVIKSAFELKTDLEVLCHAKNNGIDFVSNHLEKSLIGSVTFDNFCTVVTYAWDCSREELQQMCINYLNDNRDELLKLPAFYELSPTIIRDVLKASHLQ